MRATKTTLRADRELVLHALNNILRPARLQASGCTIGSVQRLICQSQEARVHQLDALKQFARLDQVLRHGVTQRLAGAVMSRPQSGTTIIIQSTSNRVSVTLAREDP